MIPVESWRVGFDERFPIYQQIISHFMRAIVKKQLAYGERIPSIRDLAIALKVNTNTVQRAYQEMEREQLIYSQRGMGYFVMNNEHIAAKVRKDMVSQVTSQFLSEMRALGFRDEEIIAEVQTLITKGEGNNDADDSQGPY